MFNWIKNLFGFGSKPTSVVIAPSVKPVSKPVAEVTPVAPAETKVEVAADVAKVKSTKRRPYYPEKPKASPGTKAKPKASPKKSK